MTFIFFGNAPNFRSKYNNLIKYANEFKRKKNEFFVKQTGFKFYNLFLSGSFLVPALLLGTFGIFYIFKQRLFYPPPVGLGDSLQLILRVPVYSEVFGL